MATLGTVVSWACSFDDSGLGMVGASTEGHQTTSFTTGESRTTEPVERETSSEGTSEGTHTGSSEDESGPIESGQAVLQFTDAQSHGNFGAVDIGEQGGRLLTLANVGDAPATHMMWDGIAPPFGFSGGQYPGANGTCGGALDAGAACSIDIVFEPQTPGPAEGELSIHYSDSGTLRVESRTLVGYGVGATNDLLVNGDAEDCSEIGEDPPGWSKHSGTGWQCGTTQGVPPFEGDWSLFAGNESGGGAFELRQDVDVSAYLGYAISFAGWARSDSVDDDDYRIDLVFLDEEDVELGSWSTGWQTHSSWTPYEYASSVPTDTRKVSVRLFCTKGSWGSRCDAYFDALELKAVYTPPN